MIIASRRWRARGGTPDSLELVIAVAVPCGIVGARLYHVITDYQLYFGPGRDPIDALKIWKGGLGIWGAIAARRRSAPTWSPAASRSASRPCWTPSPRVCWSPRRSAGSATGSTRSCSAARPRCRGGWRSTPRYRPAGYEQFATFHPTFLYELLWNLGVAVVLVWARPQVPAGPRQGLRALRGALHRRPVLDRGAADRHRERDRRLPAEQLHLADRVRGRAGLVHLAGPQPARAARRWSRASTRARPRPEPRPTTAPSSADDSEDSTDGSPSATAAASDAEPPTEDRPRDPELDRSGTGAKLVAANRGPAMRRLMPTRTASATRGPAYARGQSRLRCVR